MDKPSEKFNKDLENIKSLLNEKAYLERLIKICKNDCVEISTDENNFVFVDDEDIKKEIREKCAAKISVINYDLKYKYNITDVEDDIIKGE